MGRGRGRGGGRGGRGGGRGGKRHAGDDGGEGRSVRPRTDAWRKPDDIVSSGLFEEYYKGQGLVPPEEWDEFLLSLKTPLPITFRINGRGPHADRLRAKLESDFMAQFVAGEELVIEGEPVEPPHPLGWYPGRLAWQMNFSRTQLRKQPVLEALHEFIKRENETGSITRQEAVSMVPPLFMDVEPHHWVLDMCAAPGSKTFQLLEMLHAGPAPATGLVVANDADAYRCNLLAHQTKRMCSPALMVVNHEAQALPLLRNLAPGAAERHVLFDRILCDVPCSGDGTMRKAPDIWRKWNVASGNALHTVQLRITLRACELLRVGGRLVYSTCTFNPVEDEAVVADVLRRTGGAFELVDGADHLPGLRRLPGVQRWKVWDQSRWYETYDEAKETPKLTPSMFPDDASDAMPLHLCMRFLPHHQNTGGFFVAVLRKVRDLDGPLPQPALDKWTGKHRERKGGAEQQAQQAAAREGGAEAAAAEGGAEAAAAKGGAEAADAEGGAEAAVAGGGAEATDAAAEVVAAQPGAGQGAEQQPADVAQQAEAAAGAAAAAAGEAGGGQQAGEGGKSIYQLKREAAAARREAEGLPPWDVRGGRDRKANAGKHRGLDPIVPYVVAEELDALRAFYGLAPECPVPDALVARSLDPRPKKLNFVSAAVKLLLRLDAREQLKVVGAGVKVLERQDSKDGLVPCLYRFAQDGLPALLPHVTKQRFRPTVDELVAMLQQRLVGLPEAFHVHMSRRGKPGEAAQQSGGQPAGAAAAQEREPPEGAPVAAAVEAQPAAAADAAADAPAAPAQEQRPKVTIGFTLADPATLDQMRSVAMGCCVALLRPEDAAALGMDGATEAEGGLASDAPLAVACWRGRSSVNVLVSKQEAAQMVERIHDARAKAAAAAAAGEAAG